MSQRALWEVRVRRKHSSFFMLLLPSHLPSCAPAWVLYGLQSLQRSTCSITGLSMGHSPFGKYLLCYRAAPSPLTLLFPLLFPLFFPHPPSLILSMLSPPQHFQPLLRHFHRATASLADGLSGGLWWVPCKDSWSTCVWHRASPGLLPQRPHLKLLCCQALPFTSSTASKGWAFVALIENYQSYKLPNVFHCVHLWEQSPLG